MRIRRSRVSLFILLFYVLLRISSTLPLWRFQCQNTFSNEIFRGWQTRMASRRTSLTLSLSTRFRELPPSLSPSIQLPKKADTLAPQNTNSRRPRRVPCPPSSGGRDRSGTTIGASTPPCIAGDRFLDTHCLRTDTTPAAAAAAEPNLEAAAESASTPAVTATPRPRQRNAGITLTRGVCPFRPFHRDIPPLSALPRLKLRSRVPLVTDAPMLITPPSCAPPS